MSTNVDFVMHTVGERDVRFIRLWFSDVFGNLKSLAIAPEDLEEAFEEGVGFDGSSVDGFACAEESDMLLFPDAETFQILPSDGTGICEARVFCDIMTPEGKAFEGDPRACLKRIFMQAEQKGYVMNVGPQIEYFYFKDASDPVAIDHAGYFDLTPYDSILDLRRSTVLALEKMSIPVEYSYHSASPSQHGVQLNFAEAVTCADNIVTARHIIKQAAFAKGVYASFMPKPLNNTMGSAMLLHQSLFNPEGENIFWGSEAKDEDELHLSETAQHYIAGLLEHAPEFSLITNPTVNSYKRLTPGSLAPLFATWGRKNRSALVRIPAYKPGKNLSTRVELRCPDPTCNPYLGIAVSLAAGLDGIERKLQLQTETRLHASDVSEDKLLKLGLKRLPRDLGEAVENFEHSDFMREVLGDHIFSFILESKRSEWQEFCSTITEWERKHYYAGF